MASTRGERYLILTPRESVITMGPFYGNPDCKASTRHIADDPSKRQSLYIHESLCSSPASRMTAAFCTKEASKFTKEAGGYTEGVDQMLEIGDSGF